MSLSSHVLLTTWRDVRQYLHAIRSSLTQTTRRPSIPRIGQPAGPSLVVSSFFIREQQAGILSAAFRRRQSPLGIEQDGTGVRRKDFRYQRLEFLHHAVVDLAALLFRQSLLQRAALVHGGSGNYATFVGNTSKSSQFSRGELHRTSR